MKVPKPVHAPLLGSCPVVAARHSLHCVPNAGQSRPGASAFAPPNLPPHLGQKRPESVNTTTPGCSPSRLSPKGFFVKVASAEFQCESKAQNSGESADKARFCGGHLEKCRWRGPDTARPSALRAAERKVCCSLLKQPRVARQGPNASARRPNRLPAGCLFLTRVSKSHLRALVWPVGEPRSQGTNRATWR